MLVQPIDGVRRPIDKLAPCRHIHAQLHVGRKRIVQAHESPPEQELHSDVTQVKESRRHITVWACMTQVFRQVQLPFVHIVDKGTELLVCGLGQADRTMDP